MRAARIRWQPSNVVNFCSLVLASPPRLLSGSGGSTNVGDMVQPFSLPQCDGTPYAFFGPDFDGASLTVLSIAPLLAESPIVECVLKGMKKGCTLVLAMDEDTHHVTTARCILDPCLG